MTIEDEARAAAIERYSSRVIEDYDGDRYDEDEYGYDATARSAFVKGALWAASRRKSSGASANVSNRPKDDISSGGMSAEQSDTNPIDGVQAWMAADLSTALGHPDVTEENDGYRSWAEWGAHLIHQVKALRPQPSDTDEREWEYSANTDKSYTYISLARIRDFHPKPERIYRRRKAGPWEVVPDGE